MEKIIRVGIIGCGMIAKILHIPAYQKCNVDIKAVCDVSKEIAQAIVEEFGIKKVKVFDDYKKMLEMEELDAISICTANNSHYSIAMEAIKRKKHILCEKPLAMSCRQASQMYKTAKERELITMVAFTYRFVPAVRFMKHLIDNGFIGEILCFDASYLEWIKKGYLNWRFQKDIAGSGALADIGSHIVDLARYLVGEIESVVGMGKTRIKERPLSDDPDQMGKVDVDDEVSFLCKFENGATGSFRVSRVAIGRGAGWNEHQSIELNGSKGTIIYSLQSPYELKVCSGKLLEEYHQIVSIPVPKVPDYFLKIPGSPRDIYNRREEYWQIRGCGVDQVFTFIQGIKKSRKVKPDFYDGMKVQEILDGILKSIDERRWISLSDIKE